MANISGMTIGATGAAVQTVETTAVTGGTTGETKKISKSENFGTITENEETGQEATSHLEIGRNDPSGRTVIRNRKRTSVPMTAVVAPDALRLTKAEASSLKSNIKN